MKKPYGCFLPLNALAIHPQGNKNFCLTSSLVTAPEDSEFVAQRLEVHNKLARGEWPQSCRSCQRQEDLNLQSRRMKTWQRKTQIYGKNTLDSLTIDQSQPALRHLEVSFSNICNLQCAMCSSEFSSSWISDDNKAVQMGLAFRDFTRSFQKIRRISKVEVDRLLEQAHEIDLLIIKGGEPTRDPQCLEFLERLTMLRPENLPNIFLQTNGTRPPQEWLPQLQGFQLEVGFSIDGWGDIYEWIRGSSFDKVLEHFRFLNAQPQVSALSIDFTLSAFNCFHFPEFLRHIIELKKEIPKLKTCPFFQWAQESYARPDNISLQHRKAIAQLSQPLLESDPELFVNYENILKVLVMEQGPERNRQHLRRWIEYMNDLRGNSLFDLEPTLFNSF